MNNRSLIAILFILSISFSSWALTPPGTYTGTITGGNFDSACGSGPFTSPPLNVEIRLNSFSGGISSGTVHIIGEISTRSFSGSDGDGPEDHAISFADFDSTGFIDISLGEADRITVDDVFFEGSNGCYDSYTGVLFPASSSSSDQIIDPETASSSELTINNNLRSDVNSIGGPIQAHLTKTMQGDAKGSNLNESGFLIEGEGGLNAGDMQWGNVGVWLSYNFTTTENDFVRTAFESDRHVVVGGIDYSPNDIAVIGLAFAYENSETDTSFNSGNIESDGITIAPYVGLLLSETWSLDATFGMSFIDNEQFRTFAGNRISSNADTDRFFFATNLNGITYLDNWILGGRVGYQYARSSTDGFTETGIGANTVAKSTTALGQLRVGGDAAYSFGSWEPFISAIYQYDVSYDEIILTAGPQPDNDRDDILFGTGFRYFNDNGLTANFEYNKRLFRNQFDEDSWTATVRWDY